MNNVIVTFDRLWFGDERGYNATYHQSKQRLCSCGLVMKEDITQLEQKDQTKPYSCGLVMKEDITQRKKRAYTDTAVVVW